MNVKKFVTDDAAVSPVIGVILMVAITVLLAATAASFFLGIADESNQSTPTTAIGFDYDASTDHEDDVLTIVHNGGDTLDADRVDVVLKDGVTSAAGPGILNKRWTWNELSTADPSEVTAGRSVNISTHTVAGASKLSLEDASAKVVWDDPDSSQTYVLADWTSPS